MQRWQLSKIYGQFLPLLVLSLTAVALPSCTTNQPAKPFSSESLPTEAIAEISEIRSYPVRVKYINATSARPATVGAALKVNESISTEDTSTAQVTLRNGAIIRIGGSSSLTLKPQNQVEMASGRLVAWAASDRKASAQIKTPFGEVSSNDGTVYVEIPAKAAEERRVIALDGTVTVLLKSASEIITLAKGEEIRIKADGKASAPKRIDKESINKRIVNNSLIFGFNTQLASLPQIASEFGVTATVKEASTIKFRRSDLPNNASEIAKPNKVNYSSGTPSSSSTNNDRYDQREEPYERRREEPTATRNYSEPPVKSSEPPPAVAPPALPPLTASDPKPPVTTNQPAIPVEPIQPAPLEPPPQPVQPEVSAPAPVKPVPNR